MHDPHPRIVRVDVLLDQMSCRAQGRLEVGLMAVSLHQLAGGPPDVCFRKQCALCPVESKNCGHSLGQRRAVRYPSKGLTSDISWDSRTLRNGTGRVALDFPGPCFKSGQWAAFLCRPGKSGPLGHRLADLNPGNHPGNRQRVFPRAARTARSRCRAPRPVRGTQPRARVRIHNFRWEQPSHSRQAQPQGLALRQRIERGAG